MNDTQALARASPGTAHRLGPTSLDRHKDGLEQKLHRPSRAGRLQRWMRGLVWLAGLALAAFILLKSANAIVATFHWAEKRVDRTSPWHMVLAFAVTLPFSLGIPIPFVHQAWAVAIGCFFRWNAFLILLAALAIGVPLPFMIGRRLAGGDTSSCEARLRRLTPSAIAYLSPLRRTIRTRPIRASFLLMWAPVPTSFLPLLLGVLMPSAQLPLKEFVMGALPSKLLHFACDVLVGLEAGSLAAALNAHDDLPGVDDLEGLELASSRRRARMIAIGVMALAVLFMLVMLHTMHSALKEMKESAGSQRDGENDELDDPSSAIPPV